MSPLKDTVSTSPEATDLFLQNLFSKLDPVFAERRLSTTNDLAANNQMNSSVANNRMMQLDTDFENSVLGATTTFGLADIDRALENRIRLFGAGTNLLNQGTSFASDSEARLNNFNLANFENQIAAEEYNAGPSTGGWAGALTGAAGGAMAGSSFGPWGMAIGALGGGLAGGLGPSGTGGASLKAGAGLLGGSTVAPRSTATSTLKGGTTNQAYWDELLSGR